MRNKQKCQVGILRNVLEKQRRTPFVSYYNPVSLNLDAMARVLPSIFDYKDKDHNLGVGEQRT